MKKEDVKRLKPRMWERFHEIHEEAQDVIKALGVEDDVEVNTGLLGKAVVDYFEDIEALKSKEGIHRVNEPKIYAYQAYWFLKRKPIQLLKQDCPEENGLYVNEKACLSILTAKMFREAGMAIEKEQAYFASFVRLLYYNFKYRTYTQKSLELMIEGFFLGCNAKKREKL